MKSSINSKQPVTGWKVSGLSPGPNWLEPEEVVDKSINSS